ncbi:helicase-related protein [Streptomyces sp. NPDC017991]|uniref:helicase-related protein n=1 Tax=Streptomyces sp. NPDC017991 TaxID=3365026 RepID=UPI0037A0CAD8
MTTETPRGSSLPDMRRAVCKDCAREVALGDRPAGTEYFTYPEAWAGGQLERGGSRSDRCREHRAAHVGHISGLSVAYIDLRTTGEVADRSSPTGPLGALGPLPEAHTVADTAPVDLGAFGFGMDESHIRQMLDSLADPRRRVLVVKAGTGTGKSTYMPYRLLDPPEGCYRLIDNGPIIVTEPRVQATVGVATFVGELLSGADGAGPGYPVGYQVSGDRHHDAACRLVYVTDGTMINWLREGRLASIGTVIVDEAHERSTNIDFIMGYLRRELDRYPHLRVIITSATFDEDFYQQYFGGESAVGKVVVPAVKSIGYGWPLFPELDAPPDPALVEAWRRMAPELRLAEGPQATAEDELVASAWPRFAPALKESEVVDSADVGYVEDLHATTRALLPLRASTPLPEKQWQREMPSVLAEFMVRLTRGLDAADIFGDILSFLPTAKAIEEACDLIRAGLGDTVDVYALLSSLPVEDKRAALAARRKGDRRKIVVSTNLAETSLTVEGVRFVVDSGLIAQSEWDVESAQGSIRTKAHSQAGIKQRWGRVGRKAPGWVFPLYSKGQLLKLTEDTAPGSTRENLERLVMTAKMGGLDSVVDFPWPAAFVPEPPLALDKAAEASRKTFVDELRRADQALRTNGSLDTGGHPTTFGKELNRLQVLGSTGAALAVMHADRLACLPEVVSLLALLTTPARLIGTTGLLLTDFSWPDEWRHEAAERHRALASVCEDDAELVLQIVAGWERADPATPPWEASSARAEWARRWWVSDDRLLTAAAIRRDIIGGLSPTMKEEVKRFVEPSLLRRARGAITRAFADLEHVLDGSASGSDATTASTDYNAVHGDHTTPCAVHAGHLTGRPERVIPLARHRGRDGIRLAHLVTAEPWARGGASDSTGPADAVRLLVLSALHARPEPRREVIAALLEAWPAGTRALLRLERDAAGRPVAGHVEARHAPAPLPRAAQELAELDAQDELAHSGAATLVDAAPETDHNWPTNAEPFPDLEAMARTTVLDHRDVEADETACGRCPRCLAGDLAECETPRAVADGRAPGVPPGHGQASSAGGIDVSRPFVLAQEGGLNGDGWYEVVGYHVTPDGEPLLFLRPDWRRPEDTDGPGAHPDLQAGDHIEVVVGPMVSDHDGELRVLTRADARGRFLLREADPNPPRQDERAQLAVSLHRRDTRQLADLLEGATVTATVLPRSQTGHFTVTLVDLAHQHVKAATNGARDVAGVVTGAPNGAGYVEVRLLAHDSRTGLRHVISASAGEPPPEPESPIVIRLYQERSRLSLQGRSLRPVADVAEHLTDASLIGLPDGPLPEVGGSGVFLKAERVLSRGSAIELAELDMDATWVRDVWLWWARSRHHTPSRTEPVLRAGTDREPVDLPATVRVELPPELRLPGAEVTSMHSVGTRVSAVVTAAKAELGRAWLRLFDGIPASVTERDLGLGQGTIAQALVVGAEFTGLVTGVFDRQGYGMLTLGPLKNAAEPRTTDTGPGRTTTGPAGQGAGGEPRPESDRYSGPGRGEPANGRREPVLTLAEACARYPVGSWVSAVVHRVSAELRRAWLRLPDGLTATVVAADVGSHAVLVLPHVLTPEQQVIGTVKAVTLHRGAPQIQLDLRNVDTPSLGQQLDNAGVREGAVFTGRVRNALDSVGVFVEVLPGFNGLIRARDLAPGLPPSSYARGTELTVCVDAIHEDRKRPGFPAFGLSLE